MMNPERPFDMLSKALGQQVLIRMKSNMVIRAGSGASTCT